MTRIVRRVHPALLCFFYVYVLGAYATKLAWKGAQRAQRRMEISPIQSLPFTRRRRLTDPPPKPSRWYYRRRAERTHAQSQSGFFTKLPSEIRQQVYELVLAADGSTSRLLHVSVTARRLCGMRCRYPGSSSDCWGWKHGEECWGPVDFAGNTIPRGVADGDGDGDDPGRGVVSLLCCCRQMYAPLSQVGWEVCPRLERSVSDKLQVRRSSGYAIH